MFATEDEDFVVADIPGVIEGAHEGTGLGHRFLRHITRSAVLVMVLDGQRLIEPDGEKQILESYDILRDEIKLYDKKVYGKDFVIVINKIDLISDRDILEKVVKKLKKDGKKVLFSHDISGHEVSSGKQLDTQLKIIDIASGVITDISQNKPAGTNDSDPRWAPDGAKVLFCNSPNYDEKQKSIF